METSSPLAALQPPSLMPSWAGNGNIFGGRSHSHGHLSMQGNSCGPGAFNFRDISMNRTNPDYFSINPVRGSSPTASLAADLSQNFHIDRSPQLPTPRRSLFTSNLFATMSGRENVTTPPLQSSSPSNMNERMDISPLPHKQPFLTQIVVQSPSPGLHDENEMMMASSPPCYLETPSLLERKKSGFLRPSLNRQKGYSTNTLPKHDMHQPPAFRFGAGPKPSMLSTSTSMTLGECFLESPPQDRRPKSAVSPSAAMLAPPPRLKQSFGSLNGRDNKHASPSVSHHQRRPSNPFVRPRKQYRRSLSMFESAGDVVNSSPDEDSFASTNLTSVMDVDEAPYQLCLPHFFNEGQPDSIPRISKNTFIDILDGKHNDQYDQRMVVDCRFEYEFEGGHVDGAVNYNNKELLSSQLFQTGLPGKTLLIFHCEYSAHRAPIMARYIRQQDRTFNVENYPRLSYPEVYILDGGYSGFFNEYRGRCFPQNYVEMDAKEHAFTCEREMGKLRQNRSKLNRAHTFAFGSTFGQESEDSPLAPNRSSTTENMTMSIGSPNMERSPARRMVSY